MRRSALALLAVVAVVASACSLLPGGGDFTVTAEFERAFNLFPQSPVRVRGVEVGVISAVRTDPSSGVVLVDLKLEDDVELPADAGAVVITSALLGERYVQIAGGTADEPMVDGDLIPIDRTQVPFEFDEVLEGLNDFVGGLEEDEVGRLVGNLAQLLDGQGEQLGRTIDSAAGAIDSLKEADEELVQLATSVAQLNDTLVTRDQELAVLLDDWISVTDTLTSESTDLDGALDGLLTLNRELAELMLDHRETLSADVDTLTRVGRTANRNLDQFSTAILGSAELFRHAERIVDTQQNFLPLVNHSEELATEIEESLLNRLEGLCLAAGGSADECAGIDLDDLTGGSGGICLPPLLACEGDRTTSVADALNQAVEDNPSIGDALVDQQVGGDDADAGDEDSGGVAGTLDRLGLGGGGGGL